MGTQHSHCRQSGMGIQSSTNVDYGPIIPESGNSSVTTSVCNSDLRIRFFFNTNSILLTKKMVCKFVHVLLFRNQSSLFVSKIAVGVIIGPHMSLIHYL
jgi:hypothetical protein